MHYWGEWSQMKEKYGTARVYCSFGLHQIHSITHPGYVFNQYPKWLWVLDCHYGHRLLRLFQPLVIKWQTFIYRLAYKKALKKFPHIKDEILGGADYRELLKGL